MSYAPGRFYDFLERWDDVWAIALRQPIYEKDRLDPAARLKLDRLLLERFPEGYRLAKSDLFKNLGGRHL
jgi:hypothetical protein